DAMGLNRGSMYATFGDKRALYLEALNLYEQLFLAELEKFLLSGDSPIRQIHTFFDIAFLGLVEEQMRAGCLFVNTIAEMTDIDQELVKTAGLKLRRLEKAFEKVLISAQEKGELNKEKDPVAISRFLGSTMKGLRITCKETQDKEFIGSIINTALTVLEN
ncbi:MAG: TetR/AcrR family transcriptional regulator, partial [Deltaproteobacteria bacterium]|nr:TetR/AcrR family transcriptional regulator [Deltaproteobacteria bacterium]